MLKLFSLGSTLLRYWKMVHDPRTPPVVKGLVYTGIAMGVWPKAARPRWMRGQGLMEDNALAPGLISLGRLMTPDHIRDEYEEGEGEEGKPKPVQSTQPGHATPSMIGQW